MTLDISFLNSFTASQGVKCNFFCGNNTISCLYVVCLSIFLLLDETYGFYHMNISQYLYVCRWRHVTTTCDL